MMMATAYLVRDIADHLRGDAEFADAFGEHVYPDCIPQDVLWTNAVVITEEGHAPEYTLAGYSGVTVADIRIDVWTSQDRETAHRLGAVVRRILMSYRGRLGEGAWGSLYLVADETSADALEEGSDKLWFRRTLLFRVIAREEE